MLTIIGCGNSNRTDDGAGVFVARRLLDFLGSRNKKNVRVFDAGTGGIEVMFQARGAVRLIIIDACKTGSEPGAVFQVPGEELEREREAGYSLHDFRWDDALYAGRRIYREDFPSAVTVFLIEAVSLDFGLEMNPAVIAGAQKVIEQIQKIIEEYD